VVQKQKRILAMGPGDAGKSSSIRVCFENWEPARTQYLGKTSMAMREEVFLFGRRMFSFFDCGGQVSYFEGYLKDPYLFNDCCALVFIIDATLFFLAQQDGTRGGGGALIGGGGGGMGDSDEARTWTPQTVRDVLSKVVTALREKSPDARVFVMFNKMDKVPTATAHLSAEEIDAVLIENQRKLQQAAVDAYRAAAASRGDSDPTAADDFATGVDEASALLAAMDANSAGAANRASKALVVSPLDKHVPCFRTSIFSNSIVHAWSRVLVQLIEPQRAVAHLNSWLAKIRASAGGEILEVCILDSSTLLCLAGSSCFSPTLLASECAIRAKRQRLRGLECVSITHDKYNMVWQPLLQNKLQLLVVGDAMRRCTPGVSQLNADRITAAFRTRFVDDSPTPWDDDIVQIKSLLGTY
jgi:GTPase SAR1 family protein